MINLIFPFRLQLNILQLEEYKPFRYIKWNLKNFSKRTLQTKKALVYTPKVKNIILIYFLICLIALLTNIFLFLILILEPFISLTLAVLILMPCELFNRYKTIEKTRNKILSFKNLEIIAITGSFGKSSTKEILYQLISDKFPTLKTPESYNTVFGVAKVIDYELDENYKYFICEMAAYKIGEIKELCYMVPPKYGVLTGITTQHLERFGSLENIIKAKFELVDAIDNKENIVFNLSDENIKEESNQRNTNKPTDFLKATNIKFNKNGSSFDIQINNRSYKVETKLFGFANIKNILGSASMALKLGLSGNYIVERIEKLNPIDNRLVLNQYGKTTVVNNTYSSNPQGFRETIETARVINGKKALVTPGLVELGSEETKIHEELGRLTQNVFELVILVGENNRTKSFAKGLEKNYEFIKDNREEYFRTIEKLKDRYEWIFLENDLTQNY